MSQRLARPGWHLPEQTRTHCLGQRNCISTLIDVLGRSHVYKPLWVAMKLAAQIWSCRCVRGPYSTSGPTFFQLDKLASYPL